MSNEIKLKRFLLFALCFVLLALLSCSETERPKSESIDHRTYNADDLYSHIDKKILAGHPDVEGNTHQFPHREQCLVDLVKREDTRSVAEIGFNAGHSTVTILNNNKDVKLWSFDLCLHDYSQAAFEFLKRKYTDRLEMTCGNSALSVPEFGLKNPQRKFDLIHIDGGHSRNVPYVDILHMLYLSHKDTLILVDDCDVVRSSPGAGWVGKDVNKGFQQALDKGLIEPVEFEGCNIGNCLARPRIHN